ncbi:MAG: HD domain-containing protein [Chloroflexi bacterium]|nr:HD domain-containing protein [Chloroflexota bacterium]
MAGLPLPGPALTQSRDLPAGGPPVPDQVRNVLSTLWAAGHEAWVVGGALRDWLAGRRIGSERWDLATDAQPPRLLGIFPGSGYTNRFGTVLIAGVEVTTFRRDHRYGDHRRPDQVTFTDSLAEDLVRRDFTVNAIAWGRRAGDQEERWVDPTDGIADVRARVLRAVGDPAVRFDEDALRLLRGARIAAQAGLTVDPATAAAMTAHAHDVRYVSVERIGQELRRMVQASPPSAAFRILADTGLLEHLVPGLAAQRGLIQDKIPGHDLWDHSLATLDALEDPSPGDERVRLAALLHDIGKPETFIDGHFPGHDQAGARIATDLLARLAFPGRDVSYVARLIRWHMFSYESAWSDAALRRFMVRVGTDLVDDLLLLRRADNVGSGLAPDAGRLAELRGRIAADRLARHPLAMADLAVDGQDIMRALGREPGPWLGQLLARLLDSVVADPARNTPEVLLASARAWASPAHERAASATVRSE